MVATIRTSRVKVSRSTSKLNVPAAVELSGISREKHEDAMNAMVDRAAQKGLGDLVVTPREVDDMVGRVARILADGLNIALQPGLSEEEIFALSHDSL